MSLSRFSLLWAGIALLAFTCVKPAAAQVSAGGSPPSFSLALTTQIPTALMPPVDPVALLAEDEQAPKDEPYRFGTPHDVQLTLANAGVWTELPDGGRIWRLRIASPGAYSINLLYDRFHIPAGGQLFIYNDDRSQVIGAFTSYNNWVDGTNITQPVAGDATILEYYEPAAARGLSELSVFRVVHAYRNLFGHAERLDDYGDSGACNNNANCPEGAPWQAEKRGVAMILSSGGSRICTGSLINNVRNDFTPYFLTANHCLGGENTWIFMFNYESPGCPNQNGPTNQTVANATRRARNAASDFALLQISMPIPLTYNPYFAGWNNVNEPATNSVCIHHPSGDIKKITFDTNAPLHGGWSGTPANSHWHIANWEDGTTEPGSSGSPLYDQNHRITGQLHGGQANCSNNVNDYYGKFSLSWNYGANAAARLRDWLDPDSTGATVLNGIDPNVSGRIGGTVRDAGNTPLPDARVQVIGHERSTLTNAQGAYLLPMQNGTYSLEFTKFGYGRVVVPNVTVIEGDTVWINATLPNVSWGTLTGTVTTQAGAPVQGATVEILNTPFPPFTTDSTGRFSADLPATGYSIHAELTINLTPPVILELDTVITVNPGPDTTFAVIPFYVAYIEPTAADGYGYRIYDRYDRDLPAAYNWVELDPFLGGEGTEFTFSHHDSAAFLTPPFPIRFYGTDYHLLTVNNNGWMLPGEHHVAGARNTPIPSDQFSDPPGIIAPFWDDLRVGLGAQQFTHYDPANGRWIFEFIYQRLVGQGSLLHNWQVHFLDPAFYPTPNGDCEILFVYGAMGYLQLCTIGIEAPSEQTGVQVLYDGALNPTAWPIEDGAALRLTTGRSAAVGTVSGVLRLIGAARPSVATFRIGGRTISLTGADSLFSDTQIPTGYISAVLTTPGYEARRASGIIVNPATPASIELNVWSLDPPRALTASQSDGEVTLTWQRPVSVSLRANPNIRYTVYRNAEAVSPLLADTVFVDSAQPDGAAVTYTVVAHYEYGRSEPAAELDVEIDLPVTGNGDALPQVFALHPVYPNPFNPAATLAYDLPTPGHARLQVINITGQLVATLVDRDLAAGAYHTRWNASALPSGMYLAIFESGSHRFVQKLMLLK